MLGLVQSWFKPNPNPIGIDIGGEYIRMAQVERVGNETRLVAAASAETPPEIRTAPLPERMAYVTSTLKTLWSQGNFRGRRAVLALPAAQMHIQHLRMAKMEDEELKKALPWEAAGKLPIDPSQALLRHLVAGEVYQDSDPKYEVILMAAAREFVSQLLAAAGRAKLDVAGMNVEPKATIDCFAHVYRRKSDAEATQCVLDIGATGSRAFVSRDGQIFFARNLPLGGDHFDRAVAEAMHVPLAEAKTMRRAADIGAAGGDQRVVAPAVAVDVPEEQSFALLGAGLAAGRRSQDAMAAVATMTAPAASPASKVVEACRAPLGTLVNELDLCRRYYESTFPGRPIDRLVFTGGGARHRALCVGIARELGLAAQVADPLMAMSKSMEIDPRSGIDRREPQPAWTVALGLSMGPKVVAAVAK